ncbi:patatin-like phospholipase family protein [Jannaschia aquimarina]|uniref:Patatin-like phospholipase n=1 Tax=Jannaschia aquimarina TaxID=935700 RepID=A0A0D1ELK1_9RHOB|nr:patatin-like phospholipase family protein [Jannaschia aquimarina]KIT16650.1 Patatin-like phospholipase [Jannaschia aquimarina]SNS93325.1 Patatin-like phospholipase [Jannaschia aquimarina]
MSDGAPRPAPYEQIVFSGGGLRCFWHGGWMEAVGESLEFRPARITGSSGGALSAAAWIAGRETRLFDRFVRAVRRTDWNVTLDDMDDDHGRTPHQRVYEAIVEDVIDAAAQARIAEGPAFQVNVSTVGDASGATLRALVAGTIYQAEQAVAPTPRPRLSASAGVEQRLIDARQAARDGMLPDLIRMAATVPPAFRPDDWDGEPIYDGGMVDKAPLPDPDEGRTLVLLTKRFHSLPDDDPDRIDYVEPSETVLSGSKLDFTDPDLLHEAWALGGKDGRDWLARR